MPRVIFLNRFFYPDHSATSRMVSDLAFELASSGKDVHVITSRQLYDKPGADLPAYEIDAWGSYPSRWHDQLWSIKAARPRHGLLVFLFYVVAMRPVDREAG